MGTITAPNRKVNLHFGRLMIEELVERREKINVFGGVGTFSICEHVLIMFKT